MNMRPLEITLAVVAFATGCTNDGKSSAAATDVSYDNTESGLLSTTVQDAVDDVVAASTSHDERLQTLEVRNAIRCVYATTSLRMPAGTAAPHVFTAAECGGVLPDARYVGSIARYNTCSGTIVAVEVMNAGEPDGPGIVLTKSGTADCAGPGVLSAVFHRL